MKTILIVDDDPLILTFIKKSLQRHSLDWKVAYASRGEEALSMIRKDPFDIVISDIRMPGMSGLDLLREVISLQPHAVRIAITSQPTPTLGVQAADVVHQFLLKPYDPDHLVATIARAVDLSEIMANEKLRSRVASIVSLSSLPAIYLQVVNELESLAPSAARVGSIVSRDMGMSAKILQLVNSAFFGIQREISDVTQATILLGLEAIRDLVLTVHLFNQFPEGTLNKLRLGSLWDHSMRVGMFARGISASVTTDRNLIGTASTAGFLHDTGKLILARHFESEYIKATQLADQEKMHIRDAEKMVIGASHDQLGAYLLGLWGLPEPIVMAAAFHHDVLRYPVQKFNTVSAVHIADAFERQISAGNGGGIAPDIDLSYLDRLGMSNRLEQWRSMCTDNNPL